MALDKESCAKLIFSMEQMDRFPKNEHSMMRLVEKLQQADDLQMAKDIVDGFIDNATHETRCPMPGDIAAEVHKRMTERYGDYLPDPECPKCEGTAFVRVLMDDGMPGSGPRCECVRRRKLVMGRKSTNGLPDVAAAVERLKG